MLTQKTFNKTEITSSIFSEQKNRNQLQEENWKIHNIFPDQSMGQGRKHEGNQKYFETNDNKKKNTKT